MTITILPAQAHHAAHLPEVERSAGEAFGQVPGLEWIADDAVMSEAAHRCAIEAGTVWVAVGADDKVLGFLNAGQQEEILHIWEIAVVAGMQGRGIGTQLLRQAEGHARSLGLVSVTMTTFRDVTFNAPFYRRQGYRELDADALPAHLAEILRNEAAAGLPVSRRCAMQKAV
ncbi:GNAT family N-acetyltransferase [Kordiimonas aestuarii]|uniref:GNAT family N-acetyltransferase n=1 Tax=Kordiimonas aestuarii TaxID=1005925 RepID=UPI0021D3C90C|nr:GNAT family N-acetyltransferase [Kordiimonas aestuarii]